MSARHAMVLLFAPLVALSGSAAAAPPAKAQAGPPVSYTDQADDAYRTPVLNETAQVPNEQASSPELDILEVGFAPGDGSSKSSRGYTAWITVKGVPRHDQGAYVSFGEFTSEGRACTVHHFLNPGYYGVADVSCGSGNRLAQIVSDDPVLAVRKPGGGTVLSATFGNRRLPQELVDSGATIGPLTALTCWMQSGGWRCPDPTTQDIARSDQSYRLA